MKLIDFTTMGFKNLWRRKLRTVLTMVGVAIGAFSIVIMLSLGIALRDSYTKQLEEWGSLTLVRIESYSFEYDEETGRGIEKKNKLDDTMITKLKNINHVRAVTPLLQVECYLKSGKYQAYASITGIDPDVAQYFDLPKVEQGEMISNDNPTAVLFGKNTVNFYNPRSNNIFGYTNENPVDLMEDNIKITFDEIYGEKANPKYSKLIVSGVMEESNSEMGYANYAPIEQVKKWYKEKQKNNKDSKKSQELTYSTVLVSVDDTAHVVEVQDQIKALGFNSYSRADELDNVTEISNTIQLVLGGIGAVSLLVSAIGIANTMIMSIYERTKEIGVMKVLGCVVTDIRKLFLFEAGIIGFLGGLLGLAISYGISFILNKYAPEIGGQLGISSGSNISVIPAWLCFAALGFSVVVGMISGLYPAIKATKIKAIEAMKSNG
ncbi:MAG: ABC transporter permease [Clostridia bacterium]|nr:ABC transporter permease [Clostridia bacterium]